MDINLYVTELRLAELRGGRSARSPIAARSDHALAARAASSSAFIAMR